MTHDTNDRNLTNYSTAQHLQATRQIGVTC
jgi:hypothetical protein